MKQLLFPLLLATIFVACEKRDPQSSQVSNVNSTPCKQSSTLKGGELSGKVDVEFTSKGVHVTHHDFEVSCDFSTVKVTHTFVNGVLRITQKGTPNQADCVCHTDVSYTIDGILQNEVNVIFINGTQVYCHNENNNTIIEEETIFENNKKFKIIHGACGSIMYLERIGNDFDSALDSLIKLREPSIQGKEYYIETEKMTIDFNHDDRVFYSVCFKNKVTNLILFGLTDVIDSNGNWFGILWCED